MKILFRIALVLLVLSILAVVGFAFFIDKVAKTMVEEGGTYAMGVETTLDSADVGLFSGEFGIEGLQVKNPSGFTADHFLKLGKANLGVDMSSTRTDALIVPQILIEDVALELERNKSGSNYSRILKNLERFEGADTGPEPEPEEQPQSGKKFIVKEIVMRNIGATVRVEALGQNKTIPVTVPEIIVNDIGTTDDAQTVGDLLSRVLQEVLDAVLEAGAGLIPEDLLNDLNSQLSSLRASAGTLVEDLRGDLGDLTEDLQEKLQSEEGVEGLKEDAKEKASELKEKAGDAVDKAKKGLNDLLKRDGR